MAPSRAIFAGAVVAFVSGKAPLFRLFVVLVGVMIGCGGNRVTTPEQRGRTAENEGKSAGTNAVVQRPEFDLVVFGRVLGTIAPCGCTTEPLGGLQYAFGWLFANTHPGARLVLEPGSFLYPDPKGPHAVHDDAGWNQAESRADLLTGRFTALGGELVSGLGPYDLSAPNGAGAVVEHQLPRVAANVTPSAGIALVAHRLVQLKAATGLSWTVGVTSVVDPELPGAKILGAVSPPAAALTEQLKQMRAAGAEMTVVMAHGTRAFAEAMVQATPGIDVMVVGVAEGMERQRTGLPAAKLGTTWVIEPGEQLQTVTHMRLSLDGKVAAVPSPQQWQLRPAREDVLKELARVESRLTKFTADPTADPQFVANLRHEREQLQAALDAPPTGLASISFEQVKITCKLPVDSAAHELLAGYDRAVAETNRERFAGIKPPPPAKGKPGFVGVTECADCHEDAVKFWRTTVHASAWETLVEVKKDYDVTCVGCHVTGFREPGGSEVIENQGLRDVQCEVCHGPGSLHAEDAGDDPKLIRLSTTASLCADQCHTPEHSDTFDYVPYLRDILGPGHGEAARKRLGEGATGAELRKAGLAKAGGACNPHM